VNDRRINPRYRVTTDILAAVETDHARLTGKLLDVSKNGFSLQIATRIGEAPALQAPATGEIWVEGQLLKMGGKLARAEKNQVGIELANSFDPFLLDRMRSQSGAVQHRAGRVKVIGALNGTILHEVMRAVRAQKTLDLSCVTRIDSGGIGIALLALDHKATIERCSAVVRDFMRVAKICEKCKSVCAQT